MSIVHLCFRNDPSPFVAASFNTVMGEGDTVRYAFAPQLSCDFETPEGKAVGFENEVWSFRCVDTPSFHTTFNDTLYHYDATANRLDAAFILDMDRERKGAAISCIRSCRVISSPILSAATTVAESSLIRTLSRRGA